MEDFFAPPAFQPAQALVALRRQLRDVRPLTERAQGPKICFSWKAYEVIELQVDGAAIAVRWVDKPLRSAQWKEQRLCSSEQVRNFVQELRRALARWDDEEH